MHIHISMPSMKTPQCASMVYPYNVQIALHGGGGKISVFIQ